MLNVLCRLNNIVVWVLIEIVFRNVMEYYKNVQLNIL